MTTDIPDYEYLAKSIESAFVLIESQLKALELVFEADLRGILNSDNFEEIQNRKVLIVESLTSRSNAIGTRLGDTARILSLIRPETLGEKQKYQEGYESGLNWKHDYRPGGPHYWHVDRYSQFSNTLENKQKALQSQWNYQAWFRGFDAGIAERDAGERRLDAEYGKKL